MLEKLLLQNVRCFPSLRVELSPQFNIIIGRNGQGKTSILEAACILLRLQSQRSSSLAPVIRSGEKWFGVAGDVRGHQLEFRYSLLRRKIVFDGAEQRASGEYLAQGRVVAFSNTDIDLVRGGSEFRRRYLDFAGAQMDHSYRPVLRAYERALRSRNALLKTPGAGPRQIAAYDGPLIEHGLRLSMIRAGLVQRLAPHAQESHRAVSGGAETLELNFAPGNQADFAADLARTAAEERRLRQTIVGPHRDDVRLSINGMAADEFSSEGQQRTIALALKIAQAHVFAAADRQPPLLLIDDIFGELDPQRRNQLLAELPAESQKLVTATSVDWQRTNTPGCVFELHNGELKARAEG